ncbi:MAG: hypothetical protein Q8S54_04770, partial [Bacteroidota bacterium]|nr:hypothetical protein [Bacteroidota bacterium]
MENSLKNSRAILTTAAILAVQALPVALYGQTAETAKAGRAPATFLKIKMADLKMKVVGIDNGAPVFKNDKGEFFTVNSKTGDLNFIKTEEFSRFNYIKLNSADAAKSGQASSQRPPRGIKIEQDKVQDVTIVGQDAQGHTVMKNTRG